MARKEFRPKLSIITGGGSGIGAAMAKALAARGSRVILADISLEGALTVKREIGELCEVVQLNVSDEKQVSEFFKGLASKLETPDCLVNCAGINQYGEALNVIAADWMRVLSVNLAGTALMSLAAYKVMASQRHGTIINMGSMATFLVDPMFNAYTTSKFGVVGFSRSLAVEAEAYNVDVHVVCPGNIITKMKGDSYELSPFTPAMSVDKAVGLILKRVKNRNLVIVFPLHAYVYWLIDRVSSVLLNPVRKKIFQRAQRRSST